MTKITRTTPNDQGAPESLLPAETLRRANDDPFLLLRELASKCERLESELEMDQRARNREALRLVDAGWTWREVAAAAGFANPYIATLIRQREAAL